MKRDFGLAEWRAMRAATLPAIARLAAGRRLRRKPRTPGEREMIIRSVRAAVARREREGRLVQVGPREFVVRKAAKEA